MYNPTECEATSAGFKPNTIEIKTSWCVLASQDPSYYVMNATINTGTSQMPVILGLVGFHLVINTANHPEFVWATFEHKENAPDCTKPQQTPASGWSFTSQACAACLVNQTPDQCSQCMTGGNNNDTNRANIDMLNDQLVGPLGLLTQLPASSPMAVWKNYFLAGSLWTNGGVASGGADAQRGSLELANTTMETFAQDPSTNCFSCHNYNPSSPLKVSHIVNSLLPASTTGKK
jgi:hypothetical protein